MPSNDNNNNVNVNSNINNQEQALNIFQFLETLLAFVFIFLSIAFYSSYAQQKFIGELIQREVDYLENNKENKGEEEEKSSLAEITDSETFKGTKEVLDICKNFLDMLKDIIENFC